MVIKIRVDPRGTKRTIGLILGNILGSVLVHFRSLREAIPTALKLIVQYQHKIYYCFYPSPINIKNIK